MSSADAQDLGRITLHAEDGIGGIAPERRPDLARFGLRAVLGGTLATMMTATIAGVLTGFVS